ncbi:LOW QUALITY PROTEIN: nuclear export mediator factor NEMF homolog [Phalaenopsis equestris]|uniref:LOW QUALITY PROTEIN: nuclear export mediator factor NEMF homolog n=1 Tax=Phalaenopsis equestris TaxID=78828 RepID=UPI0009E19739|nr:LOW QUALITY PROTEIN: nuclear export mediator factor NEMF homolog [Phalaenopsis equestris]
MVKVRMNTADVAAEVKCLRRLIGMRCANVYDISPKTYLFKLMNSSGITESGESEKVLLLMESGVRLHTTEYVRDKNTTPSGFTLKLRKHIRTRRLEDVRQLGYDRVYFACLFQFGLGANAHYIILELYAQGNIILTDSEFTVMTLLRSHRDDDKGLAIMSRHRYPVEACRVFKRTDFSKLKMSLTLCKTSDFTEESVFTEGGTNSSNLFEQTKNVLGKNGKANDGARSNKTSLKAILGEALSYGPALAEHIVLDAGLSPTMKVGNDNKIDEGIVDILEKAVTRFEDWLLEVISGAKVPEGYILMQNKVSDKKGSINLESAVNKENRVFTLKKEVDHSIKMAELIEYNLEDVDAAILAVRVALAKGMSWDDLVRMVKEEKRAGNPIAGLIDKLHLERNCITLLLSNNLDEMDEDEKTCPVDKVEVDLALSAHANARSWYELKKKQEFKQEKTLTAHEKAFKAAEKKTRLQLAQEKTVAAISHMRKVHWFEKFNWFISSENYLIISGRDAQQNEMIVKRYMSKSDLYVHADLHGASSTVIKNHRPENPIPPLTLNQAGCFTVCHSQAWDSKIVTSAWWVYPHQVSKTAPTGEYLTVGSFMIRGRKNFLPPHALVMGFGILFRLDESSLGSHLNERRVRVEDEGVPEMENESHKEISESDSIEENVDEVCGDDGDAPSKLGTIHHEVEKSFYDETGTMNNVKATDSQIYDHFNDQKSFDLDERGKCSTSSQLDDIIDKALGVGPTKLLHKDSGITNNLSILPEDHQGIKSSGRDKPYMSKGERRRLKKNQKSGSIAENDSFEQGENGQCSTSSNSHQTLKPANAKIARGQRGKLKKIKEKYAEQDDEEREIRMALLASAGNAHKNEKEANDHDGAAGRAVRPIPVSTVEQDPSKICYKCKKHGHLSRDCPEQITLPEHSNGDVHDYSNRVLHRTTIEMDKVTMEEEGINEVGEEERATLPEHSNGDVHDYSNRVLDRTTIEMDKITMEEEGINEVGEEEREKLNDMDYLTGNPLTNDVLLYAVPVCAPYNALQAYKYHVKITPGSAKKGKGADLIIYFTLAISLLRL